MEGQTEEASAPAQIIDQESLNRGEIKSGPNKDREMSRCDQRLNGIDLFGTSEHIEKNVLMLLLIGSLSSLLC